MAIDNLLVLDHVVYSLEIAINGMSMESVSPKEWIYYYTLFISNRKLTRKFNTNWRDCLFEISISSADKTVSISIGIITSMIYQSFIFLFSFLSLVTSK